jgi:pyruvate kinase
MRTQILCTVGPASLRPEIIRQLQQHGVDLFRVNLSHTPLERVADTIEFLQRHSSVPICLDTEGPQVRCGQMRDHVVLRTNQSVRLTPSSVVGTADTITLRPACVFPQLRAGDVVSIDFDCALLHVIASTRDGAEARVVEQGRVGSNKAVTIQPAPELPAFTEKDLEAIRIGVAHGIRHFALSFAGCAADVVRLREMVATGSFVIAKIESRAGVRNMDGIMAVSDAILIDRGDLSREVPIEELPLYQKRIIRCANGWHTPAYVATNLLESMIRNRRPTVAEANDIMNTLLDGAEGLVLAAETSIGSYPVEVAAMVRRLVDAFERSTSLSPEITPRQVA